MAEIYGVITFYSRFTLKPRGKYNISVCLGTACFVKGSEKILDRAKERLKIEIGDTTPDGKFSLVETRCVGACGLAPVFMVNDEVYGKGHKKNPKSSKIFFEAVGISFEYPKGDLNSYEIAPTWT